MLERTETFAHGPFGVFFYTDGTIPFGEFLAATRHADGRTPNRQAQSIMLNWNTGLGGWGVTGAGMGFKRNCPSMDVTRASRGM